MRKLFLFSLLLILAVNAFGHAGEVHKYMGTVASVYDDGSFVLNTREGKTIRVAVSNATVYQYADGNAASRSDLAAGMRVVVTISKDGITATHVRFAATKK